MWGEEWQTGFDSSQDFLGCCCVLYFTRCVEGASPAMSVFHNTGSGLKERRLAGGLALPRECFCWLYLHPGLLHIILFYMTLITLQILFANKPSLYQWCFQKSFSSLLASFPLCALSGASQHFTFAACCFYHVSGIVLPVVLLLVLLYSFCGWPFWPPFHGDVGRPCVFIFLFIFMSLVRISYFPSSL